jgi:hypothetical protein
MTVAPTGAMRANGAKPLMHLVPPEVLYARLPPDGPLYFHDLVRWFWEPSNSFPSYIITPHALINVAHVSTSGAIKYAPHNWEKGLTFSNCYGSAIRHALKLAGGEAIDPDFGHPHEWHYLWNVHAIWTFMLRGRTELDDRAEARGT